MKTHKLLVSFLLLSGLLSCKDDFLDKKPLDKLSEATVWNDYNLAEQFANNVYTGIFSGFERGGEMLAVSSDEAENTYTWVDGNLWNRGDVTSTTFPTYGFFWTNPPAYWNHGYNFIRRCNVFLDNIDRVPGDQQRINALKGEIKFLRALYYHELTRYYGGVPIITKAQGVADRDELFVSRNSYEECVDFMARELDEAAELLPATRSGNAIGRATRGAALAIKGRVLLYAKRWDESAAASRAVIESGVYTLFPDYEALFKPANNNNAEIIFSKQYKADNITHGINQHNSTIGFGGWGGAGPTQNLVDMYRMTDGLSIQESPLYREDDPYANRDPRFYATIFHDGASWGGRTMELRVKGIEGVDGGPNGTNGDATRTGYNMRKFMDETLINRNLGNGHNNWPVIRLGEVLLNYAEALNESAGPDAAVYEAVNALRARPGVQMPALTPGLSQEEMRNVLRNERAVELAFEDHRFYDVRRWGLAEEVFNQPIYGMRISEDGKTFTRFKVEDRVFQPRHYLMPIPQQEMDRNPNLQQNPGY
jgi:starch-binding outer membrane protein, SusD/RagB family